MYTEHITVDGLLLTHDERSHRILVNPADAIHPVVSKGSVVIRNYVMAGMFDDALNIPANYYHAHGIRDGKLCAYKGPESHFASAVTSDVASICKG